MSMIDNMLKSNNSKKHNKSVKVKSKENLKETESEFSEELGYSNSNNMYENKGVFIERNDNNELNIIYNGLLAKNGANEVYSVIGYGDNDKWQDVQCHKMIRTAKNTFAAQNVEASNANINLAFKDSANNWDNNSGQNYRF